jgi:hypothetical protein
LRFQRSRHNSVSHGEIELGNANPAFRLEETYRTSYAVGLNVRGSVEVTPPNVANGDYKQTDMVEVILPNVANGNYKQTNSENDSDNANNNITSSTHL